MARFGRAFAAMSVMVGGSMVAPGVADADKPPPPEPPPEDTPSGPRIVVPTDSFSGSAADIEVIESITGGARPERPGPLAPPGYEPGSSSKGKLPTIEATSGRAFAGNMVTHNVYARLAGDEEWRFWHGSNWANDMTNAMEIADNKMWEKFGIDFWTYDYVAWDSTNNSEFCGNAFPWNTYGEMIFEVPLASADMVIGFSKNNGATGTLTGCAISLGHHAIIWDLGGDTAGMTQHELGHTFGAPDRYLSSAGDNPGHYNDTMEDPYNAMDLWCVGWPTPRNDQGNPTVDYGHLTNNAGRFG